MAHPPVRGCRVASSWLPKLSALLSDTFAVVTALLALVAGAANSHAQDMRDSVVLDFTATWCGPCQQMSPIVHKLEKQGYAIRKVDVDKQPSLARSFKINSIPTFVLVIDGEEQSRITGLASEDQLRRLAQQVRQTPKIASSVPAQEPKSIPLPKAEASESADEDPEIPFAVALGEPKTAPETARLAARDSTKRRGLFGTPKFPSIFSKKEKAAVAVHGLHDEPAIVRGKDRDSEGADEPAVNNEPCAASVRIRVSDETGVNFGSGTIIDSRVGRTTILACGHLFRPQSEKRNDSLAPKTVEVDIFLPGGRPETYVGKVLDYDPEGDVGVVTIATAGTLPMTPVAPLTDAPTVNASLVSIGCGGGENPAEVPVRVTALNRYDGPDNIECTGVPVQGRSGGGLFDAHGQLVGVCIAADQEGRRGLYAGLQPIYDLLARAGLKQLLPPTPPTEPGEPANPASVPLAGNAAAQTPESPNVVFADALSEFERDLQSDAPPPAAAAALSQLFDAAPDAEVICIVRPKQGGPERVVILNQASTKFVTYLLDSVENSRGSMPQNASLRVEDPQERLDDWMPEDSIGVPKPAGSNPRAVRPATMESASTRFSPRPSRFGSRSAN